MSSNFMQRIADLEAQVKSIAAERDGLKRELAGRQMPSAEEFADAIGKRLVRVEQNLREDFVGKFAGNFLLATETITKRLENIDQKQTNLEVHQKTVETKFKNHIAQVTQATDTGYENQQNLLQAFLDYNKEYMARHDQTLKAQRATAKECQQASTGSRECGEDVRRVCR